MSCFTALTLNSASTDRPHASDSEALAPVVAELEALQAIFGDGAIRFHRPSDLTWASRDGARVTLP